MPFTGKEDHSITLDEATNLTRNYRNKARKDAIRAGFFGKEILQKILDQKNCVGIRIYYGEANDGKSQLVLVGSDAQEKDLTGGVLAEKMLPCPPYCNGSQLNS